MVDDFRGRGGSPWGSPPGGGGGNGSGRGPRPPDIDEIIKNIQNTIKKFLPGGSKSGGKSIGLVLIILGFIWLASGLYRVLPDEQGVVLRFGKYEKTTQPGLNYHIPYPVETVLTPKVTKVNRMDVGFRAETDSGFSTGGVADVPEESLMLTGDENIVNIDFSVFSPEIVFFDILVTSTIFYFLILWVIKFKIIRFFSFIIWLASVYILSTIFELVALEVLLRFLFLVLLIALPIVHQNEIRKWINYFWFFSLKNTFHKKHKHRVIKELKHALEILVRKKIWAIIVFEKHINLSNYCATWIILNSKLSKELLINIFFPKSPLHDWAIIVKNDVIISAWSVLPLSHNVTDIKYWTRHKAWIWISELTDAVVVVASEERWEISFIKEGEIWPNISLNELENLLTEEKI